MDTISKLLQVNKKHSKNALIFYLIVVALLAVFCARDFVSLGTYEPLNYIKLLQTL